MVLAAVAASVTTAQTADGYIKVGSDQRNLRFARAAQIPDDLDKSKQMIHLVLSEAEIPSKALFDDMKLFDIRQAKVNQIVELNFRDNSVNWFLTGKGMEGTRSMSQSPNPFPYQILAGAIKGKIEAHGDAGSTGAAAYEISVTYTAPLEKPVIESAPTAADAAAAAKSPAVKAYLDLVTALRAGDKAKIMSGVPAEKRAQMDSPDFPKMLAFVQSMMPQNLKVLKVVEKDGVATLTLSGTLEGSPQKGEATMKLEGGKWLMMSESWRN